MFKLIRMPGCRTNVPEPERLPLSTTFTAAQGQPIIVKNGTASLMQAASTLLPTHMTWCDAKNTKEILAFRLSPGMIFEVRATDDPSDMLCLGEYLLSADGAGISATAVQNGKRGAVLVNKNGAEKAGDTLLVCFPCH